MTISFILIILLLILFSINLSNSDLSWKMWLFSFSIIYSFLQLNFRLKNHRIFFITLFWVNIRFCACFWVLHHKPFCREFNPKFPTCEKQNIEKTHVKEKQSYPQDNIYVVRQYSFSISQKRQQQTLITKLRFLHPSHRTHNGLQNEPKIFLGGNPNPQEACPWALQLGPVSPSLRSIA